MAQSIGSKLSSLKHKGLISDTEYDRLKKALNSLRIDEMYQLEMENAEEFIPKSVLDKIKGYVDHIRNTGMGKKKSLEFIEKFIEGLKEDMEKFDKIRAEAILLKISYTDHDKDTYRRGVNDVLKIIDKYKAENGGG